MPEVSLFRLYLLRAMYLLIAFGEGAEIWPLVFHHRPWELMHGVAVAFLAALTLICLLGARYPLRMLPILLYELLWKSTWLLAIALPLYRAHALPPDFHETVKATLMGVILVPLILPWPYVLREYVLAPGDRWK